MYDSELTRSLSGSSYLNGLTLQICKIMCLFTEYYNLLTAEENITCYKVLALRNEKYNSPYFPFVWKLGIKYKIRHKLFIYFSPFNHSNAIDEGFNSFEKEKSAKKFIFNITTYYKTPTPTDKWLVAKCTIPKGSKYCKGLSSCLCASKEPTYISNQLIINEIIYEENSN